MTADSTCTNGFHVVSRGRVLWCPDRCHFSYDPRTGPEIVYRGTVPHVDLKDGIVRTTGQTESARRRAQHVVEGGDDPSDYALGMLHALQWMIDPSATGAIDDP